MLSLHHAFYLLSVSFIPECHAQSFYVVHSMARTFKFAIEHATLIVAVYRHRLRHPFHAFVLFIIVLHILLPTMLCLIYEYLTHT